MYVLTKLIMCVPLTVDVTACNKDVVEQRGIVRVLHGLTFGVLSYAL